MNIQREQIKRQWETQTTTAAKKTTFSQQTIQFTRSVICEKLKCLSLRIEGGSRMRICRYAHDGDTLGVVERQPLVFGIHFPHMRAFLLFAFCFNIICILH